MATVTMTNPKLSILILLIAATSIENSNGCCPKSTTNPAPNPGPNPAPAWKCESKTDGGIKRVAILLEPSWVQRGPSDRKIPVTKNIGREALEACLKHATGSTEKMGATDITLSADGQIRSSSITETFKTSLKSYADYKSALPVQGDAPKTGPSVQHQLLYKGCKDLVISTEILANSPTTEPKVCVMVATAKRYVKSITIAKPTEDYEAVIDVNGNRFFVKTQTCTPVGGDNYQCNKFDIFFALGYTTDKTQALTDMTFSNAEEAGHENQLLYSYMHRDAATTIWYLVLKRDTSTGRKMTEIITSGSELEGYTGKSLLPTLNTNTYVNHQGPYFIWKTEA